MGPLKRSIFASSLVVPALAFAACSGGGGSSVPSAPGGTTSLLATRPQATATPKPSSSPSSSVSPSPSPSLSPTASSLSVGEMPAAAGRFVDSVGADSHFGTDTSPYVTQWGPVSALAIASGIHHLRDGRNTQNTAYLGRLAYLGHYGITHSVGFQIVNGVPDSSATVATVIRAQMPYVDAIEPANEYDGYRFSDANWATELRAQQQILWATRDSDASFAGISVEGPAMTSLADYGTLGPLDALEDEGNLHFTTCALNPGNTAGSGHNGFPFAEGYARLSTLSKPMWTTETGYGDDPVRPCALPDDIIAKYDPRMIAERFNAGDPRTYFYQLVDMPLDTVFGSEGLIDRNGVGKPQYASVSSLLNHLADSTTTFPTTPLTYSLAAPAGVHHTLLQKSNGTYELLLWQEAAAWQSNSPDNVGGVRIAVAPVTVTLTTPKNTVLDYLRYDPTTWLLGPSAVTTDADHATALTVTDAISIVELR